MSDNIIKLKIEIDGKEANASINLTDTNIKELYKSFKYGKQEVNGLTTAISQGFNNAREILIGFNEATSALSSIFTNHIKAFQGQEKASIQLATALKQQGNYTAAAAAELEAYATQLQQITVFGDEQIVSVMAQLQAMGLSINQTKEAALQTANLASLMGTDLNGAARVMADVFNGNAGMISRYIKGIDRAVIESGNLNLIIKELNKSIGGQAEALRETSEGAMVAMSNAYGDMQENIGMVISYGLTPLMNHLASLTINLNNLSPVLTGTIGTVATLTAAYGVLAATGIGGVIKQLLFKKAALESGIFASIRASVSATGLTAANTSLALSYRAAGVAAKSFMASIGPLGWLILGVTVLAEGINLFANNADDAANKQNKLNDAFKAMELDSLRKELKATDKVVIKTGEQLNNLKKERNILFNTDTANLNQIKIKNEEIADIQNSYNKLLRYRSELLSVIKEKEDNIKASVEAQYKALRDKLDIDLAGTDTQKAIESAKKEFENQKSILKEKHKLDDEGIKKHKDYLDAEKVYQQKISDIKNKAGKEQKNDLFNKNKTALSETQRHAESMLKIEEDNELLLLELKVKHFNEMILLYEKFNESTIELINRRLETEKELELKRKPPQIEYDEQLEEDVLLKNIIDIEEYKKSIRIQSRLDEIENWYKTEQERLAEYEHSIEAQLSLDEEYARRKNELARQETEERVSSAAYAFSAIGGMVGRHTVLGQMAAIAQTLYNTYEAASKALTAGPIVGPILAGIITSLGLAQVANIKNTPPPTGYAAGGRFKKGQTGFIEGYHNEIIAPEKTFVEVFKNELRPQIYNQSSVNLSRLEIILNSYLHRVDLWANTLELQTKLAGKKLLLVTERAKVSEERNRL